MTGEPVVIKEDDGTGHRPDLELALYMVWVRHPDYATASWAWGLLRERWKPRMRPSA